MARATTGLAYLTFGVVVLGGLVFTMFVTVPSWSELGRQRELLVQKREEETEREAFLNNIDARIAELKTHERDTKALELAFPSSKAPAELMAVLHSISTRNGVLLATVSEPKIPPSPPPVLPAQKPLRSVGEDGVGGSAPAPTPSSSIPVGRESAHEFSLVAKGTYAQIRAFLGDLERSLRFLDLPAVELAAESKEAGGLVQARITARMYLVRESGHSSP